MLFQKIQDFSATAVRSSNMSATVPVARNKACLKTLCISSIPETVQNVSLPNCSSRDTICMISCGWLSRQEHMTDEQVGMTVSDVGRGRASSQSEQLFCNH